MFKIFKVITIKWNVSVTPEVRIWLNIQSLYHNIVEVSVILEVESDQHSESSLTILWNVSVTLEVRMQQSRHVGSQGLFGFTIQVCVCAGGRGEVGCSGSQSIHKMTEAARTRATSLTCCPKAETSIMTSL